MNFEQFSKTKNFDTLMAVPLISWFGYNALKVRGVLARDLLAMVSDTADLLTWLQFGALFTSVVFDVMLIWLLIARTVPVKKSKGLLPRLCGFAGTFLGVGALQLPVVALSLPWQALANVLVMGGTLASALVLARLGKSFSIMPEARILVTSGPYAYARHPLYAVEMITIAGIAMQFQQPWAGLIAVGVLVLQVSRSLFEEQVLAEAYPEYETYRAKTARFIPGVI